VDMKDRHTLLLEGHTLRWSERAFDQWENMTVASQWQLWTISNTWWIWCVVSTMVSVCTYDMWAHLLL
jgi:hypothetical protein